jgi:uncharacterized protein YqiB (DUF1249 family)
VLKGSNYKVDLRALHAQCEANYARLKRLFPDYESVNSRRFNVGGEQLHIEVLERSRYTTAFRLQSWSRTPARDAAARRWLPPLRLDLRAYHDAGMLEVVDFQRHGRTEGRYAYPNPRMHQQDEKARQNGFLADWLEHCLRHGEAPWESLPGAERV